MARFRFSLASLMGVVFLLAAGLTALRSANEIWFVFTAAIVWGALTFALLGIIYCRDTARRFWTGFVLFGLSYFAFNLNFVHSNFLSIKQRPNEMVLKHLYAKLQNAEPPTIRPDYIAVWISSGPSISVEGQTAQDDEQMTDLLRQAAAQNPGGAIFLFKAPDVDPFQVLAIRQVLLAIIKSESLGLSIVGDIGSTVTKPNYWDFMGVGMSLMMLLSAFVGGLLASVLFRNNRESHVAEAPSAGKHA